MGSSSKPKDDPVLDEINMMTLARLKKEETDLAKTEAERQSMLATGRMGMSSLLSRGFTGFLGHVRGPKNNRFRKGELSVKPASILRAKQQKQSKRQAARKPAASSNSPQDIPVSVGKALAGAPWLQGRGMGDTQG